MDTLVEKSAKDSTSYSGKANLYRRLLRQVGFRPRKSLGQHFLIDKTILRRILSAAELNPGDIVIEVGPGLGVLTEALARRGAQVVAVEVDSRLVGLLEKRLGDYANVKVVRSDILKVAPRELLENNLPASEVERGYKVIANLPYYITSPVLSHFLEAQPRPSRMVVMVQKEVGESIVAASGKMRFLSVKIQFYGKPTIVAHVPAASFYPRPKVDSVVLRLDIYPQPPIKISDVAGFFDVVMHGFRSPRKQIRNSLSHSLGLPASQVVSLLDKAGIDAKRRAETLSLEEWKEIWKVFAPFIEKARC